MSEETGVNDSSELFAELNRLSQVEPSKERSAQVWQVFGRSYGNDDRRRTG